MATHKEYATKRKQIAHHVKQGETIATIAKRFNVTGQYVRDACREFSIDFRTYRKEELKAKRKQIANHIQQGETVQTIAKRHHVTTQYVRDACKEFSIPLPDHHQKTINRRKLMAHCVTQGETPKEVATKFGVTRATVYSACKEIDPSRHRATPAHHKKDNQRNRHIMQPTTYAIIATLQNTTNTLETIAQLHQRSKSRIQTIQQECRKAGIQMPHRRKNTTKEK